MRTITYNKTYQELKTLGCNIEAKRRSDFGTRVYLTIDGNRIELLGQREGQRNKRKYLYEDSPASLTAFDLKTAGENTHGDTALRKLLERLETELSKNQEHLIEVFIGELSRFRKFKREEIEVLISYK